MSAHPIDWAHRAQQVLADSGPVASPCRSVCIMDEASGCCQGCWRTLPEIAAWGGMTEAQKRQVWTLIADRSGRPQTKKTGV